jgi:hypothetical protein
MMKRLSVVLCAIAAGCGDRTPPPAPAPIVHDEAAQVPHHAAPSCPLAPALAAGSDGDATELREDGINGETRLAKPAHGGTCEVADSNLERVERTILGDATERKPVGSHAWNHKAPPQFDALVDHRLVLDAAERTLLARNGFVVPARLTFDNYATAFHEIYQSQLPVYVSVDAIFQAIYAGNDSLIQDLEDRELAPKLAALLDQLACALPSAAVEYPADATRDLDLYVAVARALLRGDAPISMFGDPEVETAAAAIVKQAVAAQEMTTVSLFGRERVVDFTAYTPRSHYAVGDARQRYFRASMWLSRLELNLVSRSSRSSQPGTVPDPSETPREDVDALALADLVDRAHQLAQLGELDTAWALFAGRREDVSIAQLVALRDAAGIAKLTDPDAAAKLRLAIGDKFQRTARLHYMPEGSKILPAIATFLGPRVVPDAAATRPLVNGEVPDREVLTAADMAYVLGHDRARDYLADDRKRFPTLDHQLDVARKIAASTPRGTDDLYSAWLDAIAGLANHPTGTPSFMQTPAYADLRLDSALAAFGQLKHNFVLIAGESYFEGGCEIPDGYVEPAPATYDALLAYADRGKRAMTILDRDDALGARSYFDRLANVLAVLRRIQSDELADRELTSDERGFLSMVAEMEPGTTGGPPSYTGWWFDMFRLRELDGLARPDFIASFFTGGKISYVGATAPRLGVFVIDTGGAPRLAVGPVARAYEYRGDVAHRLDDDAGRALVDADRLAPWAASYTAPTPAEPDLALRWEPGDGKGITVAAVVAQGRVTIEMYDHHRQRIATATRNVGPGVTKFPLKAPHGRDVEGLHLRAGDFNGWYDLGEVESMVDEKLGSFRGTDND